MRTVKVRSYAKVNFNLRVLGRMGEYHRLDSVTASIDLFDALTLSPRRDKRIVPHGGGAAEDKLIRAGEEFVREFSTGGADIRLRKGIPVGGGLGGSSADVAGVLRGLAKLYKVDANLAPLASRLTSDGVFQMRGGYGRMSGKGDEVEWVDTRAFCYIVLLFPGGGVDTADVFREYDRVPRPPSDAERTERAWRALRAGDFGLLADNLGNDLYESAAALSPNIAEAYRDLLALAPRGATMSGSGSTLVGLYDSKELVWWAAGELKKKYECIPAKLLPSPRE